MKLTTQHLNSNAKVYKHGGVIQWYTTDVTQM